MIAIYQQPGANGLGVSKAVHQAMVDMKSRFPEGLDYVISLDTTDFVRLSIKEVQDTLFEAVILVILVVFLFLQNFRATIICTVAIFVALIGMFTGMLALGFSINLLTLFGLVLAIGIVVDDAIVVVENVERNMTQFHLPPKEATVRAMGEVTSPVIATVLVAITIAISVTISGFVALTLTPAMCGIMLRHTSPPQKGPFAWFNRQFDSFTQAFGRAVVLIIKRMGIAFVLLAVMVWGIVHLFGALPTSFVPGEDQGYVITAIIMPDAASLDRTEVVTDAVDKKIFEKIPGVENRTQLAGYSLLDGSFKTNSGTFFVTLKPFEERYKTTEKARTENVRTVLTNFHQGAKDILLGMIIPFEPPAIPGIGTTGGFEFWIQDSGAGELANLEKVTQQFLGKARQRPEFSGLNSTFRASAQQLRADVDRARPIFWASRFRMSTAPSRPSLDP